MVKHIVKSKKNKQVKKHKFTKKSNRKTGGSINDDNIFQYIKSIGFEIETTDLIKFTLVTTENQEDILINSALTNIDLEYGYFDENEYTDIIDKPELKFKITNDSAEDSKFNEELEELVNIHKNDEDCENVVFQLKIPKNTYLKQTTYDIKIREPDTELHNCSSFTDVEWIITYYKPQMSKNIILNTFYNSMILLRHHLSELVTIQNSQFYYLNEENEYVKFENTKINQTYVLPGTSLLYFNSSIYDIKNYDINQDLKIVVQMTFSCDILYVYRIMKKLLSIEYSAQQIEIVKKYLEIFRDNTNIISINKLIQQTISNENFDLDAIDNSLEIVKNLFQIYNNNTAENRGYLFESNNDNIKKIKMYFFLIIYKIYIYLNSYFKNKEDNNESLFKKSLSFAVRHSNYFLYLEIKKLISYIFTSEFKGKDEKYINDKIIEIINNIIKPIDKQKNFFNLLFQSSYIRNKKRELYKLVQSNPEQNKVYFGNPLYSISSYFYHFENQNKEEHDEDEEDDDDDDEHDEGEEEKRDWLVSHNVDEKSTKFELNNDTIIIEFRDFPSYCYLNLFISSDDNMRGEILQNNIGTLTMKIINDYMALHNIS